MRSLTLWVCAHSENIIHSPELTISSHQYPNRDISTVPDEAFDQGWIRLLLVPISLYALMFDHSGCINILQWEVELPMAGILVAFRGMHRRYDGFGHHLSFNVNRLGHRGFQFAQGIYCQDRKVDSGKQGAESVGRQYCIALNATRIPAMGSPASHRSILVLPG
jgi:hypothetical protein